jgi:hypothetical protein
MKSFMRILSFVAVVAFFSSCTEEVKPVKNTPTYAEDTPPKPPPCSGGGNCG